MKNLGGSPNGRFDVYDFIFECNEGEMKITSSGFKLFVRSKPVLLSKQYLDIEVWKNGPGTWLKCMGRIPF